MKKKIWVHQSASHQDEAAFNLRYYLKMSPSERLATAQFLRGMSAKLHGPS